MLNHGRHFPCLIESSESWPILTWQWPSSPSRQNLPAPRWSAERPTGRQSRLVVPEAGSGRFH